MQFKKIDKYSANTLASKQQHVLDYENNVFNYLHAYCLHEILQADSKLQRIPKWNHFPKISLRGNPLFNYTAVTIYTWIIGNWWTRPSTVALTKDVSKMELISYLQKILELIFIFRKAPSKYFGKKLWSWKSLQVIF